MNRKKWDNIVGVSLKISSPVRLQKKTKRFAPLYHIRTAMLKTYFKTVYWIVLEAAFQ